MSQCASSGAQNNISQQRQYPPTFPSPFEIPLYQMIKKLQHFSQSEARTLEALLICITRWSLTLLYNQSSQGTLGNLPPRDYTTGIQCISCNIRLSTLWHSKFPPSEKCHICGIIVLNKLTVTQSKHISVM